ncbi:MAG: L-aspartate oxidase [Dethiobacter sp.]|jgi:L-aspartate oxidase|nr:L-aspartate oxidase [Dethiobacter sp.]
MLFHGREKPNQFDIIIVGSGIAGLYAALKAASFARVCLLTKAALQETNTWLAQGGIAAALSDDDSPDQHLEDTLQAGAGLCDIRAVEVMVKGASRCISDLLELGTPFDTSEGCLAMTREGAHRRNRVLHAGGDATGAAIQQTLQKHVLSSHAITVRQHSFVTDILAADGRVYGVKTLAGETFTAGSVVLAAGGLGQVYSRTTNPVVATGDGVAMAFRAGAQISDMEFIQFHPTVYHGRHEGETFLLSEALRGEGAVLRNVRGERFMDGCHELAELGPRDVVARAILEQMLKYNTPHVYLDITRHQRDFLKKRFPTIYSLAAQFGHDLAEDWLPVSPAAHYAMGGVHTGLDGETSLDGLYACGEVACSGVHGANRLASNSLLEGLVFASRAVDHINRKGQCVSSQAVVGPQHERNSLKRAEVSETRESLRRIMFSEAGILRNHASLTAARIFIKAASGVAAGIPGDQDGWELKNLITVADLITKSALLRQESRGSHYRLDYPRAESSFKHHLCRSFKLKEEDLLAPVAV